MDVVDKTSFQQASLSRQRCGLRASSRRRPQTTARPRHSSDRSGRRLIVVRPLVRHGRQVAERGAASARVVPALDVLEDRAACLGPGRPGRRLISSRLSEAWNASHTALSKQSPIDPIEISIPLCSQRSLNSSAVYRRGRSGELPQRPACAARWPSPAPRARAPCAYARPSPSPRSAG